MLIFKEQGGLGNQMFIYAMARSMEEQLQVEVKLDIISQKGFSTKYMLNVFNIRENFAGREEIERVRDGKHLNLFEYFMFRLRRLSLPFYRKPHVLEESLNFSNKYLKTIDPSYFSGLWQTEKYFKPIESIIRTEFTFRNPPDEENRELLRQIADCSSVSLHCRRGDFVYNPKDSIIQISHDRPYFLKALSEISNKTDDIRLYIFTDDPDYAKENLNFDFPTVFVTNNQAKGLDYADIRLMSACKHHILSTSTFSWWGAWLNPDPGKIVIAPKVRLKENPNPYFRYDDYYPDSWILI